MMNTILLRLYLDTVSKEKASRLVEVIKSLIGSDYLFEIKKVEVYWKNEAWYEALISLENVNDVSLPVFDLEKRLGGKWVAESDEESFFSQDNGGESCIKEMKWAHLEII